MFPSSFHSLGQQELCFQGRGKNHAFRDKGGTLGFTEDKERTKKIALGEKSDSVSNFQIVFLSGKIARRRERRVTWASCHRVLQTGKTKIE